VATFLRAKKNIPISNLLLKADAFKQEEAKRYEKMELARWAVEQVILARSGDAADLNAESTVAVTAQAELLIKFVTDSNDDDEFPYEYEGVF